MSWLFTSGGQIVGSFSFRISPSNEYQGWFPLGLTGLISLLSKGDSCCLQSLFQHNSSKASILQCSAFFIVQLSHPDVTVCNWMLFCHEKGNILPFVLDLEHIVPVGWIRQKVLCGVTYMKNIKKKITCTNKNRVEWWLPKNEEG